LDSVKYFRGPPLTQPLLTFRPTPMADAAPPSPKKTITAGAWQAARVLVYAHRGRLGLGLVLLLVNRLAGLVLLSSSKWVSDGVIAGHRPALLLPLALGGGGASLVHAITGLRRSPPLRGA